MVDSEGSGEKEESTANGAGLAENGDKDSDKTKDLFMIELDTGKEHTLVSCTLDRDLLSRLSCGLLKSRTPEESISEG